MKREIKFRGKNNNGEWVYGSLLKEYHSQRFGLIDAICFNENGKTKRVPIDGDTIGQFTGLKDKNGVDIYEGDMIQHTVNNNTKRDGEVFINTVEYYDGSICGWRIRNKSFHKKLTQTWIINQKPKVVGNIHDNK